MKIRIIKIVLATCLLLTVGFVIGCTKQALNGPIGEAGLAPSGGFTKEVDEPSTRGQVKRISVPDMDIQGRIALSSDGNKVAFSARRINSSDLYQLYMMDISGGAPVKITAGGDRHVWDPSFTSDGKFIIYRSGNSFWKIRKDGSGSRMKIPGSGLDNRDWTPQVSSTNKIVFVTWDGYKTSPTIIWTSGLNGEELTQYREGETPVWSPDGSKIAFSYGGDIWIMNSDGRELTQLTSTDDVFEGLPTFSPDGNYIAYASDEESNSYGNSKKNVNIWTIRIDGKEKTQVTALKSWDSWPAWAPDGIYFLSGRGKGKENVSRVWRISTNESK